MRNLPVPSRDEVRQHLIRALAQYQYGGVLKGYAVTDAELDEIIALYDQYDAVAGTPLAVLRGTELPEALRAAVMDGFSFIHDGAKMADVRTALMRGVRLCPVCGITYPNELDHFLPKTVFRPLAVYIRNLVPSCHDCNNLKRVIIGDNPARRFVHAYLEPLPVVQFLTATVSLEGGGLDVDFAVIAAPGLSAEMLERLTFQFGRLKLNKRYGREINTYMTSHAVSLGNAYKDGQGEGVRSFLLQQAAVEAKAFHVNHWRPVLLKALADDADFCGGQFEVVLPKVEEPV